MNDNDIRKIIIKNNKRDVNFYIEKVGNKRTNQTDKVFFSQVTFATRQNIPDVRAQDFTIKNIFSNLGFDRSNKKKFNEFVEYANYIIKEYDLTKTTYDIDTVFEIIEAEKRKEENRNLAEIAGVDATYKRRKRIEDTL